ncbi:fructokinase [Rhodovulum iodosum]|uniref:Fructokinase n=1 Tax=Rhodovulum iodosum TaxID=68291 RepID=A0ABV3XQI6_9RHOB|nr:carbohydrate kinase [Rhodovulum robiginosum]RSK31393.1 carbohydrate kinase [Rhodovulum robiginosum]
MILCCGEALIDMLPRRTAEGEAAYVPHAGGAVFNTAIALGRLGAQAGMFTGLSTDVFGDQLAAALEAAGVESGLALRADRPTTLAVVMLSDGQARYSFYDEGSAGRMLSPDALPALPDAVEALFFGGISLMVEPCGTAYETLMAREAASRVTMLDPNIRPGFIADETAYRDRLARMLALADIVKLSDEDLAWLEGPGEPRALARGILAKGPQIVFLTHGGEGALALTRTDEIALPAPPVEVADTVGAGDTFNAGVLAALQSEGKLNRTALAGLGGEALSRALALGIKAAAITVSRPGANPPWAREIA